MQRNPVAYLHMRISLKICKSSHHLYCSFATRNNERVFQLYVLQVNWTFHFTLFGKATKNCSGICRDFNRFEKSNCDVDGSCIYNRPHICSLRWPIRARHNLLLTVQNFLFTGKNLLLTGQNFLFTGINSVDRWGTSTLK